MNIKYKILLKHSEWQMKRRTVLKRDNYRCRYYGREKEPIVQYGQYHADKCRKIF